MLRFLLGFLLLLLTIVPIRADDAPVPAPELYTNATRHLRQGQVFQTAINDLQKAVSQDPKNESYHLALGCAEADRAASLGYAAQWTKSLKDVQTQYPKDLADWKAAQRDPKSDDFGAERPTPPPDDLFYHTKDDGRLFRLTQDQAAAQIKPLSLAATQEWSLALSLAKTPTEKAEAEYIQGWGIQILAAASADFNASDPDSDSLTSHAQWEKSRKVFEDATKDAPNNATYWQSLGDADYSLPNDDFTSNPSTLDDYRHSLKLKPGNTALWYRIFDLQERRDTEEAEKAITQAARYDPSNAYPQYQLAAMEFKKTKYNTRYDSSGSQEEIQQQVEAVRATMQEAQSRTAGENAISDMERGNAAPQFSYPIYEPPVPAMMQTAWEYWRIVQTTFPGYAGLRELARSAIGYADFLVWEKNFPKPSEPPRPASEQAIK